MTITPRPEQEKLIALAIEAGLIRNAEDVVEAGLDTLRPKLGRTDIAQPLAKNLVELFARSPFAGTDMDFERDRDTGREIDL